MSHSLPGKLIKAIESGKAILFTGAGFSSNCKNYLDKTPPRAKFLAHEIAVLGGFEKDDDLPYVADRYLHENSERAPLIKHLKNTYTLRTSTKTHQEICALPWMRFYTTNYDNSIEIAGQEIGKRFETASVETPPSEYQKSNLVVHINGSILSLSPATLETSFKLSESSYNSPDGFLNSVWFHNFKNDISRCSALVFVGYSLYDIDIKRMIASCEGLDIYFITRENINDRDSFTFNSYGQVIKCGVDGFGELVSNVNFEQAQAKLAALEACSYAHKTVLVRDKDLENLFIFGIVDDALVEESILGKEKESYFFSRSSLVEVENNIKKQHVILTSELGNGKSAFLKQLAPFLLSRSHHVYTIEDPFGDIVADIDLLVENGKHFVFLLDDYYRYPELLRHLAQNYSSKDFTIIATSRPSYHERIRANLNGWGFEYVQYSLDCLDDAELDRLVSIVDSLGQWAKLAGMTSERKKEWIRDKNDSSLAYFLLSLFDSEDIKERINKNLSLLFTSVELRDVVFAIAILKVANLPTSSSLISEVAGNDYIYKSETRNDPHFQNLFQLDRRGSVVTSSVFATHLLKSQFTSVQIKDRFLNIAEVFNGRQSYSHDHKHMFKHVLKFSSLERILKDEAKINTMANYYEDLKRRVSWLKRDPHYWLQYGMAYLAHRNYDKAEKLFSTAYSYAEKKPGYYTDNIDTQQARLYLKKYIQTTDANGKFEWFENAHRLLVNLEDDRYKFKQIDLYRDVIEAHYKGLSKKKKAKLKQFCSSIITSDPKALSGGYRDQEFIERVVSSLTERLKGFVE